MYILILIIFILILKSKNNYNIMKIVYAKNKKKLAYYYENYTRAIIFD